jgi:hypothetical protein
VQEPDKIIRNFSDTDGVDDARIRKREPKSRMDAFSEGPQNLFSGHQSEPERRDQTVAPILIVRLQSSFKSGPTGR